MTTRSIFFVRHQAAGVLHDFPFEQAPSGGQVAAIARALETLHGDAHPKTGEPYWLRVVEVPLLGPEDVAAPAGARGGVGSGELEQLRGDGAGEIRNPK
jgi:hypothetical protein